MKYLGTIALIIISLLLICVGLFFAFIGINQPVGAQTFIFYSGLGILNFLLGIGLVFKKKIVRTTTIIYGWLTLAVYALLIYSVVTDIQRGNDHFYGIMIPFFFPSVATSIICLIFLNIKKVKEIFK